jgi:hypothetical protein
MTAAATTTAVMPSERYQYSTASPIRSRTANVVPQPLKQPPCFSTITRIGCCCGNRVVTSLSVEYRAMALPAARGIDAG